MQHDYYTHTVFYHKLTISNFKDMDQLIELDRIDEEERVQEILDEMDNLNYSSSEGIHLDFLYVFDTTRNRQ